MKKSLPLSLLIWLLLLGAELLLSLGTPLVWLLSLHAGEVLGYAVLVLFESAGLLLLLMMLGAAFGAFSRSGVRASLLLLTEAVGAHSVGILLSLVWQALFFRQAISERSLALILGNLFDNALLPLFISFLIVYACILKGAPEGEPKNMRDTASAPVNAAILASSLIFGYRFIGQLISAIRFVNESFGFLFLKPGEKAMLFLDFIPIFAVSAGGYFLMLLARRLYLRFADVRSREGDAETKKAKK